MDHVGMGDTDDGPRVAPDRPKASGARGPRVAVALALAALTTIGLVIVAIVILLLL